jgi:hypothetical protein
MIKIITPLFMTSFQTSETPFFPNSPRGSPFPEREEEKNILKVFVI